MTHLIDPSRIQKLVSNFEQPNGSSTTYDLRIGTIIVPNREAQTGVSDLFDSRSVYSAKDEIVELPPAGIAWVISLEDLTLEDRVTGHVDLVNAMSRKGLLAVNTGVIDPTYNGPISTVLINFSSQTRALKVGERFFRVTFTSHARVQKSLAPQDREKYINSLIEQSRNFPNTFLDLEKLNTKIEETVNDKMNQIIPRLFPLVAFAVGLSAIVITMLSILAIPVIRWAVVQ